MGREYSCIVRQCALVVSLDIGRSDVYNMYSSGPRMLPWDTPEWIWKLREVSLFYLVTKWRPCRYEFSKLKYLVGRIFLIV